MRVSHVRAGQISFMPSLSFFLSGTALEVMIRLIPVRDWASYNDFLSSLALDGSAGLFCGSLRFSFESTANSM
jgi:hypothetical protein